MAERQYIGARYVPKFFEGADSSSDWVANTQYEALTIVTRNGNSYTSKKPVPASVGAPENNSDYWVSTGIYNQQIETIVETVNEVSQDVVTLTEQVFSSKRHIVIIADSYGTYNGAGAGYEVTYNLLDRLVSYLNWDASYIHYSAENGTGFCEGSYLTQLNNLVVADDVKPLVTDVYVIGGWNDENGREGVSEAAFITATNAFKTAALTKFPNAKLHACFCAWSYQSNKTQQNLRDTQGWYSKLVETGWCYHNNFAYVLHKNDWFIGGNVHPNQNGVNQLAKGLCELITTDNYTVWFESTTTTYTDLVGTIPSNGSIRVQQTMMNGLVYVQFLIVRGGITLTETTSIVCDGNHAYDLFTLTGTQIIKGYANNCYGNAVVSVYDGTNAYSIPGFIRIIDGGVSFVPDYYFNGSTYLTISATKISIPCVTFTCKPW